jgi:hypothetical protein
VGIIPSDFAIQERTNLFDVAWGKQSQRKMGSGKKDQKKSKAPLLPSRRSPEVREADALAAGDTTATALFVVTPVGFSDIGNTEGMPPL